MSLFDSLVHVADDGQWLGATRYDASLDRLLREMDRAAVERACLVAIADYTDNATVARCARQHRDRFVPIAGLNPGALKNTKEVYAAVSALADNGFPGIKLHPRLNQYDPLDPRCLAAIDACGGCSMVVFLCTLFRQRGLSTRHPADVVDCIANSCTGTRVVLLHAGGPALLEMFELVRMHAHLVLDLSFTLLRYAGSSLDIDIRFVCRNLDQRIVVGSDFPEYLPSDAYARILHLTADIEPRKQENILFRNLTGLFGEGGHLAD